MTSSQDGGPTGTPTAADARLTTALADRYRIERKIGHGGMATVYLAHDLKHDRNVALKVLRPELAAVIGGERFLAEITTTANLQHPHILALFDSGTVDGTVYYVMPYVEGESLRDRLMHAKQLPVDEALRIATEVADALEYAHARGIIHRDIKPENILLHGGHALVADFGIALAVARSDGGTRMTETGMSLGTPHYMSPEQAMGEREITPAADVYALGCVLYEMLTGEPPFSGPTAQAIVAKLLTSEPEPVTALRKTVPPHVEAALETALQKLPADRFASAAQFAAALQNPAFAGVHTSRLGQAYARGARSRLRDPFVVVPSALALAAIAVAVFLARGPAGAASALPPFQFVLTTTDSARPIDQSPWPGAISPDGGTVVYTAAGPDGQPMLYSLRTDGFDARPIPGTSGAFQPYFSPAG